MSSWMSYNIILTDHFIKEARKLTKKYRSLNAELKALSYKLTENPTLGVHLGHNVHKVRLALASKGKGKSGGGRVITLVKVIDEVVYMVSIYDKGQLDNLTKEQNIELLEKLGLL